MGVLVTQLVGGKYNTGRKDALKTRSIKHKYNSFMLRETEGSQAEVDPRLDENPVETMPFRLSPSPRFCFVWFLFLPNG